MKARARALPGPGLLRSGSVGNALKQLSRFVGDVENGTWEVVVVDDVFRVLRSDRWPVGLHVAAVKTIADLARGHWDSDKCKVLKVRVWRCVAGASAI